MENMYGVGVTNRYNLFLEEEVDPIELLQDREKEKELRKRSKFAEKENKGKPETKSKTVTAPRKGIKESANIKSQEIKAREGNHCKILCYLSHVLLLHFAIAFSLLRHNQFVFVHFST